MQPYQPLSSTSIKSITFLYTFISFAYLERFERFLTGEPVDRVPVAFFHHFVPNNEWFKGLVSEEIFEKNVNGHRNSRAVFDPDVIKVMNDSLMMMPVDFSEVGCASELRNIKPPAPDSAWMQKTKELTLRALEFYKDSEAPKYVTGFSPFMVLRTALLLSGKVIDPRATLLQWLEEDTDAFWTHWTFWPNPLWA